MDAIEYRCIDRERIALIKPLWEKLNEQHRLSSVHFKSRYERMSFEERIEKFARPEIKTAIDIAETIPGGRIIAYCISSISRGEEGEIDSIYIEPDFRGRKIGRALMERALEWFDAGGVTVRTVAVAAGNEAAYGFYEKFGFYPALTVLRRKERLNPPSSG